MKNRNHRTTHSRAGRAKKCAVIFTFFTGGLSAVLGLTEIILAILSREIDVANSLVPIVLSITLSLIPLGLAFLSINNLKAAGICLLILSGFSLYNFATALMGGKLSGAAQYLGGALPAALYITSGVLCLAAKRKESKKKNTTDHPYGMPAAGNARPAEPAKGKFRIVNGEIVEYTGDAVHIDIPETVDGQKVTKIGIRAFCDKGIESVTIPSSVREIKGRAFENNKLSKIALPGNLEWIDTAAFGGNQLTEVKFPPTLTKINHGAFKKNRLTEVYIPDSVTYIGEYAFTANPIKSASMLSRQILDTGSFDGSVTVIERCKNANAAYRDHDFEYQDTLAGFVSVEKYLGDSKHVTIPDSYEGKPVDSIADNAFRGKGIESVVIPHTVKVIGEEAFYDNQLAEVVIPDSVEVIYSRAFQNNRLSSLTLSRNLTQLGAGAFTGNNFTRVRAPYSLVRRNEYMKIMLIQGFDAGVKIDLLADGYDE